MHFLQDKQAFSSCILFSYTPFSSPASDPHRYRLLLAKMRDVRKYSAVVTKLFSQEWMVRCLESNIDLIDIIISQQFPKRSYLASLPFYSYTSTFFFHNCHLDCVSNLFIHLSIIISSNINWFLHSQSICSNAQISS